MPLDIEHVPISVSLILDEWQQVVCALSDLPDIRGRVVDQVLSVIGPDRRGALYECD